MRLCHKEGIFSQLFFATSKSTLNLQHFPKKEEPHRCFISEITDEEKAL